MGISMRGSSVPTRRLKSQAVVDLPGNLLKAHRWIEALANLILCKRFNPRVCQPFIAKVVEGILNQLPAETLAA